MQIIGLTKVAAFTVLTFTLSTTAIGSQTNQNSLKKKPILYSQSQSNRNLAEAYFNGGNVYYNQEKWDLALAEYSKAIVIDPNHADAYNNRGNVYLNQKKWNLAVDDYTRSIAINPNLGEAYNNRGLAYLKLGDFNKARENFQRAAQLHLAEGNTSAYQDTIKLVNSLERSSRGLNSQVVNQRSPVSVINTQPANQKRKISPSNHKFIIQSFLQEIKNFQSNNLNKTQFETTPEYQSRLSKLSNIFSANLQKKGINIDNTYNIEIGQGSFNTTYDADQELLRVYVPSSSYFKIETKTEVRQSRNRRGIEYVEETESYNLKVLNSTEMTAKIPPKGFYFSLKRSDAKQLLSNKELGIIMVSQFVSPFVNTQESSRDKLNILNLSRTPRIYGGSAIDNALEDLLGSVEDLARLEARRYRSQGYTSYILKSKTFYLNANVKEILVYNKKTKDVITPYTKLD
jgi:tetratricopeptide (TPR) repeat protein